MYYPIDVQTNIEVNSLRDLPKLKAFMENLNMKINKSFLARKMGVDRRTIDKYLQGYEPSTTRERGSKIDDYYETISSLLLDDSQQKFFYKRVLWQYLKDNHGLECSQSNFRRYISMKPEFQKYFESEKKRKLKKEVIRYETPPGEQAQLDWKENIRYVTKDGEVLEINVCVLLLSYSRFRTYHVSLSKSQSVLLSFLTESFEAFGGVPKVLVTDNMKTVMDEPRTAYRKGKVNVKFQQFAQDMNFEVHPCKAGRPQTKAKVEAPMKILDEIHAYQGKFDYEELHHFIQKLCMRVNTSYHQGTNVVPLLAFKQEKSLLSPLPNAQIRVSYKINHSHVKVNPSNMITYKSNQYSVPAGYIGKTVGIQTYDEKLYVYYSTKLLVQHSISQSKINYKQEHYVDTLARGLPSSTNVEELAIKNLEAIDEVYKNDY